MSIATSRRRSPSTLKERSMNSRSRVTSSSVRLRTRVSGLTFVACRIWRARRRAARAVALDVGQPPLPPLLPRQVHARDACHPLIPPLALLLLVLWVLADHQQPPAALHDLALLTHPPYGCPHLHRRSPSAHPTNSLREFVGTPSPSLRSTFSLPIPIGAPAPARVVGRQFHLHPVARQDANEVDPHLPPA